MTVRPLVAALRDAGDMTLCGGKAANLAKLLAAGFPVPDGFVVTTEAYRLAHESDGELPPEGIEAVRRSYCVLESPRVAVRSSATAEDMPNASMAGQYETYLGLEGEEAVIKGVQECWSSLHSPRTHAYLESQGIAVSNVAMAVVVQRLVPAEVAGVLFTANPRAGAADEMMIEAAWGLGEGIVSGLVQPDRLRLDRATGRVLEAAIADKAQWVPCEGGKPLPVDETRRRAPCLNPREVERLWKLGRRAQEHFGSPQDVEWAICRGEVFILQSRAITTLEASEACAKLLGETRADLRRRAGGGTGPWARHNLSETLPHPTPLTWSVMGRFMSGSGGFGALYRLAGFHPSARVCSEGFLVRIAGGLYMDLALAPEIFFEGFPFRYDPEEVRRNPNAAQAPPEWPAGSLLTRVRGAARLGAARRRMRELGADFDRKFSRDIVPPFVAWCLSEKVRDLAVLSVEEWISLWKERERKVLDDFAPQSLLPGLILGMAVPDLRALLDELFWDDDPDELLHALSTASEPDLTVCANAGLYEVAQGRRTLENWLEDHGHRAPNELDLAVPRWRERPRDVEAMALRLKGGASPIEVYHTRAEGVEARLRELNAKLPKRERAVLRDRLQWVRRYHRFREDGRFYLMLGYDLLRDLSLEAGRRLGVGEDVFLLTREELFESLTLGYPPLALIAQRRAERRAESRTKLPDVIDVRAIERLGEQEPSEEARGAEVFSLSDGSASGPVRIVRSPEQAGDLGRGYILVCPSTDPSWTPLFVNAAGIVLERGGLLSHGAVVARELGIPAVVSPNATERLKEGETITVDAGRGLLLRASGADAERSLPASEGVRIRRDLVPPAPGAGERKGRTILTGALFLWGLYFSALFLLPGDGLYQTSLSALDRILWPLIPLLGRPLTVAAIAAVSAALLLLLQACLTDVSRLREAKRRAGLLKQEAGRLPLDSPRRAALLGRAAPVQGRMLGATFVPLAVFLGPLVMTFFWLTERMEPALWNPEPGTPASAVVTVGSDLRRPVTLNVSEPLYLDGSCAPSQALPPIREKLEALRAKWSEPSDLSGLSWEARASALTTRDALLADLSAYLSGGVPPQPLMWKVRAREGATGKFPVTVAAEGQPPLQWDVILGDDFPPGPKEVHGAPGSSLLSLKGIHSNPARRRIFWAPFETVGWSWDAGWLTVYLLAYLPAMAVFRWLLRVP